MTAPALIYIHGFNSSPLSAKAQQVQRYLQRHLPDATAYFPALPYDPSAAMALLEDLAASHQEVAFVGSSLGGFYATWLAEKTGGRAVLINPAVRPWRYLNRYQGEIENYHTGERVLLQSSWADLLPQYHVETISRPEKLLVLLQTGDETLDWRDAWQHYSACNLYRALGGSHSFDHFDDMIPLILRFCALTKDSV